MMFQQDDDCMSSADLWLLLLLLMPEYREVEYELIDVAPG
jgi:hypothetical protein